MRRVPPLLIGCLLLSGCFVFDEIDAGMESMKSGQAEKPPAAAKPAPEEGKPPTGSQWWSTATSLNRGPADAEADTPGDPHSPVSCRLGGDTRFMRRGDCLSQGGTPAR